MADQSALVFSGIVPHPPIMVPEVGQESIADVRSSIDAMTEFTRRLVESKAETVILISPHAPLELDSFVAYDGPEVQGDFANFRAPNTQLTAPVDQELLDSIVRHTSSSNYVIDKIKNSKLDHGTAVPLYFLLKNGWRGKVVALGYSFLSIDDHLAFGSCIRKAVDDTGRSVAFVASGDLSHRLRPDAPAGYNPGAYLFDQQVVHAMEENNPQSIVQIDPNLRKLAGECGYRSMVVALGATRGLESHCEVLSYEAPFGVGYMVAQLTDGSGAKIDGQELPKLAREAVETFTRQHIEIKPKARLSEFLRLPAPCFVSLKTLDGELRGCIGTIEAMQPTLAEEIVANAINAATRDPRFSEVSEDELANLKYSVDVLLPAEPAQFEDLDPKLYGVIVEDSEGRRGLLLPDIPGVDNAQQQVEIAKRKAGIPPGKSFQLLRFKVERFREK